MTDSAETVIHYRFVESTPVGRLLLAADEQGLRCLHFTDGREYRRRPLPPPVDRTDSSDVWQEDCGQLDEAVRQLNAYFAAELQGFDLPLAPQGTDFQIRVWDALREIPWGETISYGELACRIGQPNASRAVGLANARNPISIIVPCHRVIGRSGKLVGYGGGLSIKQLLLQHETTTPAEHHHRSTNLQHQLSAV